MSRGRGVDQKGRSKKEASHVRFYQFELDTPAFRSLPVGARALLIEIKSLYNGHNNGELFLSTRDAARRLNVDKSTPSDWFWDLQDRGFIKPKVEAGFTWKTAARERMATCWILTEFATADAGPTRDFQHWTGPPKPRPKNIRRPSKPDSLSALSGSLPDKPDSAAQSAGLGGQIRPISPENVVDLSGLSGTDNYQGQAALNGHAAAGLDRDETPSANPAAPSKVVKITRGKISAARRARA
jgi:hypothetical protein